MKRVIIIYGSTTGTTEKMSKEVEEEMKSSGLDATVKNVSDTNLKELSDYEAVLLGCSTWGDGELQEDFIDFEEKLRGLELNNKKIAVFGPGKNTYSQFCKAVDILEETAKQCGAHLIKDGLKVDVSKGGFEDMVRIWAKNVARALN